MKNKFVFSALAVVLLAFSTAGVYGQTTQTCSNCNGSGSVVVYNPCPNCSGKGYTMYMGVRMACYYCGQTGIVSMRCVACDGTGRVTVSAAQQAEAAFQRGNAAFNQKNWDKAITEYTECIRLNPSAYGAYNNRGLAYQNKGDAARANADFEAARRISSAASVTPNYVPPPSINPSSPSTPSSNTSNECRSCSVWEMAYAKLATVLPVIKDHSAWIIWIVQIVML